jgi:hypothetical protein
MLCRFTYPFKRNHGASLNLISSARIFCDSNHSQNLTRRSVPSPCNSRIVSRIGEICEIALFGLHMSLEVQFQMKSLSPIVVDLLRSWQGKPYCVHNLLKFPGYLLFVCLKHSRFPGISNTSTNRTLSKLWSVAMTTVEFFSCLSLANTKICKMTIFAFS